MLNSQQRKVISPETAIQYLSARKFDVPKAVALYEANNLTRQREGLFGIDSKSDPLQTELQTGKFTVLVSNQIPLKWIERTLWLNHHQTQIAYERNFQFPYTLTKRTYVLMPCANTKKKSRWRKYQIGKIYFHNLQLKYFSFIWFLVVCDVIDCKFLRIFISIQNECTFSAFSRLVNCAATFCSIPIDSNEKSNLRWIIYVLRMNFLCFEINQSYRSPHAFSLSWIFFSFIFDANWNFVIDSTKRKKPFHISRQIQKSLNTFPVDQSV